MWPTGNKMKFSMPFKTHVQNAKIVEKKSMQRALEHKFHKKIFSPKCTKYNTNESYVKSVLHYKWPLAKQPFFETFAYRYPLAVWRKKKIHFTKHAKLYKLSTHTFRVNPFDYLNVLNAHKTVVSVYQALTTEKHEYTLCRASVHVPFHDSNEINNYICACKVTQ